MISVEGLVKRYGSVTAVDHLTFDVARGEVVGILGTNGAGKTTTMRILTGTLQADEGRVLLHGRSLADDLTGAKRRIGYLPEANPLYDDMLVSEYLTYSAHLREIPRKHVSVSTAKAAAATDITSVLFRPIAELSKGFRQRVGFAAAILHEPDVLVLDEPTEGLDPNQRVEMRRLVSELGRQRTVLLSTHVMQEAEATCSRLIVLNRGRLAAEGSVRDLLANRSGMASYIVEAQGDAVAESLSRLTGVISHSVEQVDDRVRVRLEVAEDEELRPAINALAREKAWVIWELVRERVSLERLFRHLTLLEGAPVTSATEQANLESPDVDDRGAPA